MGLDIPCEVVEPSGMAMALIKVGRRGRVRHHVQMIRTYGPVAPLIPTSGAEAAIAKNQKTPWSTQSQRVPARRA